MARLEPGRVQKVNLRMTLPFYLQSLNKAQALRTPDDELGGWSSTPQFGMIVSHNLQRAQG
jgi:hypothetical protein